MQQRDIIEHGGITFIRFPESKSLSARRYYYPFSGGRRMRGIGALHQVLWRETFGPIPKGHHVHHKDENPLNNAIDNLECLTATEHRQKHGGCSPARREHLDRVRPLAGQWHGSEEGRQWHARHASEAYKGRTPETYTCPECGKAYESTARRDRNRFCTPTCAQRWYYRNKTLFTERPCPSCGIPFLGPPGKPLQRCSRSCARRHRRS